MLLYGVEGGMGDRQFLASAKTPILKKKNITFLAVTLNTVQAEVIRIQQPEIGSSDWEVNNPDVDNQ